MANHAADLPNVVVHMPLELWQHSNTFAEVISRRSAASQP